MQHADDTTFQPDDPRRRSTPGRLRTGQRGRRQAVVQLFAAVALFLGLIVAVAPAPVQAAPVMNIQPIVGANSTNDATNKLTVIVITGQNLPVVPAAELGEYTQKYVQVRNPTNSWTAGFGTGESFTWYYPPYKCNVVIGASSPTELVVSVGNLGAGCGPVNGEYIIRAGDAITVTMFDSAGNPYSGATVTRTAVAPGATPSVLAVAPPFGPETGGNPRDAATNGVVVTTSAGSRPTAFWFGGYQYGYGWYGNATTQFTPYPGTADKYIVVPPAFVSQGKVENYGVSVFVVDAVRGISSQNCGVLITGCANQFLYVDSNRWALEVPDLAAIQLPDGIGLGASIDIPFPGGPPSPACGLAQGQGNTAGASVSLIAGLTGAAKIDAEYGLSYSNANLPQAMVGSGMLTVTEPITFSVTVEAQANGCLELQIPGLGIPGVAGIYVMIGAELKGSVTAEIAIAKGTYGFTGGWVPYIDGRDDDTGLFGVSTQQCVDDNGVELSQCINSTIRAEIQGTVSVSPLWLQIQAPDPLNFGYDISVGAGLTAAATVKAGIEVPPWPPVGTVDWGVCASLRWAGQVSIPATAVTPAVELGFGDNVVGPYNIIGDPAVCPLGDPVQAPIPPASASTSSVSTNAAAVPADGATAATVTVTVRDDAGAPIAGKAVALSGNAGSSPTIGAPSGPSDQNGVVTFAVTSTTAEAVTFSAVVDEDDVTIDETADVSFAALPASATRSTVGAGPQSLLADGVASSTITVTVRDAIDSPVVGRTVTLAGNPGSSPTISAASGPSDENGVVTFTVSSATAETVTLTAAVVEDGVTVAQTAEVAFTSLPASATMSTLTADPASVIADGAAQSTVTVTVLDALDAPIVGRTVTLAADAGSSTISVASGPSEADGTVTFTVSNNTVEVVTYTATVVTDGITIDQTAAVSFIAVPPPPVVSGSTSTVSSEPTSVPADGTTASTVTVTLLDTDGTPIEGRSVSLAPSAGTSSTISDAGGPSDEAGVVTFTVTNSTAEVVIYTATESTDRVALDQTAEVTFTRTKVGGADLFAPLEPARLLDTRPGQSTIDARFAGGGLRDADSVTELQVAGRGGVPDDASSVVLNVTVDGSQAPGYVTVFPCDNDRPLASSLNYEAGQTIANVVVAKIGGDGTVCLYTKSATHLIADVKDGYFPNGSAYGPLVPERLLDTRLAALPTSGLARRFSLQGAESITELQVTGSDDVPDDAGAVVVNVTVTGTLAPGYVTVFPCGTERPTASNLNYVTGQTIANTVIAKVGVDGKVCLFTKSPVDIIVDINGFFSADADYGSVNPARLLDTREGESTADDLMAGGGQRSAESVLELQVAGRVGVPSDAGAVVLTVTVVDPLSSGFVTVFPCGAERPTASNLNYVAGQTIPNTVIAKVGVDGKVCIFTKAAADIVADSNGYFPGVA